MAQINVINGMVHELVTRKSYTEIRQTFSIASKELKGPRQRDPVAWVCNFARTSDLLAVPKSFDRGCDLGVSSEAVLGTVVFPFVRIAEFLNTTGYNSAQKSEDSLKCQKLAEEMYNVLYRGVQFSVCGGVSHWSERVEPLQSERRRELIQAMLGAGAHEVHSSQ